MGVIFLMSRLNATYHQAYIQSQDLQWGLKRGTFKFKSGNKVFQVHKKVVMGYQKVINSIKLLWRHQQLNLNRYRKHSQYYITHIFRVFLKLMGVINTIRTQIRRILMAQDCSRLQMRYQDI